MLHKKTSKIKIWSLILCACVLLSCLPFSAFAGSGDEANWGTSKDNLTGSGTLAEAVAAAENDSTIKYIQLNKSWTATDTNVTYYELCGEGLTFDLNGKTVSGPLCLRASSGSITFTDSVGGGKWENTVSGASAVNVSFATATITGGSYKGYYAVSVGNSSSTAVIENGTFTSTGGYVVSVSSGMVTIEGGVFVGDEGVRSGSSAISVTVTGGDFSGCSFPLVYWGGTLNLYGYPTTTVTGTTPLTELTLRSFAGAAATVGTEVKLPDGYGFYVKDDEAQTIVTELAYNTNYAIKSTGGTTVIPEAKWGTSKSSLIDGGTLEEAIAAAKNDSTIKYILLNKSRTETVTTPSFLELYGNELTVDLNGQTVSAPFCLRVNSGSVTFTDSVGGGEWECTASGVPVVIVLGGTATFTGGSYKGGSTVYVNGSSGTAVIKGGTFNAEGDTCVNNSSGTATIEGGVFVGNFCVCAGSSSISTTVTGGDFSDCIYTVAYYGGVLDLSGYPTTTVAGTTPITELTFYNVASAALTVGTEVKLPTDYGFYKKGDTAQTIVTTLAAKTEYAIKSTVISEAKWGTSKSNLTGSGTLAEAFAAAAESDSTIKYILLNKSWTATGDGTHYFITGDELTFDLNGKTVSGPLTLRAYVGSITFTDSVGGGKWENTASDGSAVKVDYATATFTGGSYKGYNAVHVNDSFGIVVIKGGTFTGTYGMTNASGTATIEGGTFVGNYGAYLCSMSLSTTITGGDFSGCSTSVLYYSGTLDMSGYPVTSVTGTTPITELTVYNGSNVAAIVGTEVKLPRSYGFYMIGDEEHTTVTELAAYTTYAIEKVIPEANWGTSESNLTGSGTLAEAVAAAENGNTIKYIQLNKSWTATGDEIHYYITGDGLTFDLNGKTVSGPLTLRASVGSITFTDSVGGGKWENTAEGGSPVIVDDATATITGGSYKSSTSDSVYINDGTLIIKGGTFTGDCAISNSSGTVTIEGGAFNGDEGVCSSSDLTSTTITGGDFSGCTTSVIYYGGTLDLSGYPTATVEGTTPITELTVWNLASDTVTVGTEVKLPTNYGFYMIGDEEQTIVTELAYNTNYAIKSTVIPEAKWGTDKDHLTGFGTLAEAVAAADSDRTIGYILLNKSFTSTENFYHALYTNVLIFDLNGKTVSGPIGLRAVTGSFTFTDSVGGGKWENTAEGGSAVIVDRATVTITGGSYKGTNAVYLSNGSAVAVIKGGTFTGIIFNYSGTATIEGGTFVGNFGACCDTGSVSTTIKGGDFSDCLYTVVYYGGVLDLSGYPTTTVAGTTPITELTVWNLASDTVTVGTEVKLPTNYGFYKEGDKTQTIVTELAYNTNYAIKSTVIHEAKWGTDKDHLTGSGTLEEAIAAAENDSTIKYICLNKSWTATGTNVTYYWLVGDGLTFDLNGKTVSGPMGLRANRGSITFTDSVGGGMWENTVSGSSAVIVDEATATFTGGSYKGGDAVYMNHGTAVIKGGTFTSTKKYAVSNSGGTLTVEGGVFKGKHAVISGSSSQATTITGGDFSGCTDQSVAYFGGTLDISGYPTATVEGTTPITELTVYNGASDTATVGTEVKLPSGYGFYQVDDTAQTVVTELAAYTDYAVKFVGDTVSVTITWTSMEFTYTDGAWNPDKHGYDEGTWTTSGGTVTVENNGNAEVTVSFDYTASLDGIDGEFDKASFDLLENESNTTSLTIVGTPSEGLDNERIGTVTVCIAKKVQAATD